MTTHERRQFEINLFHTWKRRAEQAEQFLGEAKDIAHKLNELYTELFVSLLKGETFQSHGVRNHLRHLQTNLTLLATATHYGITPTTKANPEASTITS